MANPAWSSDNVNFTPLPGFYRLGGRPNSSEEENIVHETGNGRKFVYSMYTRTIRQLIFTFLDYDLQAFQDLQDYAAGESFPFYFSLSGAGSSDSVYMRKEQGFDPKETGDKSRGYIVWEYTLSLTQELV